MTLIDGQAFVLGAPTHVPAVWGDEGRVLWAQGESLIVTGPEGVGKSTLVQRVALARAGIGALEVCGHLVTPDPDRVVLYVAADRPAQIARSMRRMVVPANADDLARKLAVWPGPLPFDLAREPGRLLALAREAQAGTVVVDSLKDVASPLSDDAVGAAVNRALGLLVAAGVEVVAVHHNRKATADNRRPIALADVYGSRWITGGAGSVVGLWGEPGDPIIELRHLKQPASEVGPLELTIDHARGIVALGERPTLAHVLAAAMVHGVEARVAAAEVYAVSTPSKAQVEKVRRQLAQLVERGEAARVEGDGQDPARWYPVIPGADRVAPRAPQRDGCTDTSRASTDPENTGARTEHAPPRTGESTVHPPIGGARARQRARAVTPDPVPLDALAGGES